MEPAIKHCGSGPGYATPLDAFHYGEREKLLYVTCIVPNKDRPDYLATINVDPTSETYFQVINRMHFPYLGDEVHHTGWNACSSCFGNPSKRRSRLIVPGLMSSRIYIVDVDTDPRKPCIEKIIEPEELFNVGSSTPHTVHCLPSGKVMISCLGNGTENKGKGSFVMIDGKSWKVCGTYGKSKDDVPPFGYDFWYQPYHNVMISTEWGEVCCLDKGFDPEDIKRKKYGTHLNVFDWEEGKLIQRIDLGLDGVMPLEIRFLHDPKAVEGFVASALNGNIYRFYKAESGDWVADKVIGIPAKAVEGWTLPEMPPATTDILISMDDKYLYLSNWVHGDIRQYNIQDTKAPKLTGQLFLGGSITREFGAKVITDDHELKDQPHARFINGKRIHGGPQMLQLSLDGRRLYVTTSLFTPWDEQFYPDMLRNGSMLLQVHVDHENGGMSLDEEAYVDFGAEPNGSVLAHEVRYPGGDCTSDIYLVGNNEV